MSLLRFPKTFEHTHKIKIGKSLKRVDSDCFFLGVLDFTGGAGWLVGGCPTFPIKN